MSSERTAEEVLVDDHPYDLRFHPASIPPSSKANGCLASRRCVTACPFKLRDVNSPVRGPYTVPQRLQIYALKILHVWLWQCSRFAMAYRCSYLSERAWHTGSAPVGNLISAGIISLD